MAKMLIGKAALTAIRLTDGRRANIAAGRAVPENIDPDDAARLLREEFLMEVEVVDQVAQIDPAVLEVEGPTPPVTRRAVPAGLTADDVARVAEQERLSLEATAAAAAAAAAGLDDEPVETEPFTDEELAALPNTVDGLLDAVGDNPTKAEQVRELELQRPTEGSGKQRASLLNGLQDVLDAAAASEDDDQGGAS